MSQPNPQQGVVSSADLARNLERQPRLPVRKATLARLLGLGAEGEPGS